LKQLYYEVQQAEFHRLLTNTKRIMIKFMCGPDLLGL